LHLSNNPIANLDGVGNTTVKNMTWLKDIPATVMPGVRGFNAIVLSVDQEELVESAKQKGYRIHHL